jgi:DNA polymerase III delta prime subunit
MMVSKLRMIQIRGEAGLLVEDDTHSWIDYNFSSNSLIVKIIGDAKFVIHWYNFLTDQYEEVKNVIEWIYSSDGQSIEIPVRNDREPIEEMYPFLEGRTLADYYDTFMASSASILLLIGPPGTGKTTFIRGLLQHAGISALVTYDPGILAKDHIFASFVEGDRNVMIIEDADNFLGARQDGNDLMHKFLNVGDGLVTTKNKKMIFSTNLPSVKDVDSALIRPGRCFDILHFGQLNYEQAQTLADKLGVELPGVNEKYSIADVFHKQVDAPRTPKRKLGFM